MTHRWQNYRVTPPVSTKQVGEFPLNATLFSIQLRHGSETRVSQAPETDADTPPPQITQFQFGDFRRPVFKKVKRTEHV